MRFKDVLAGCRYEEVSSDKLQVAGKVLTKDSSLILDAEISGISYDSRKVTKDSLFVAISGENFDGHDFVNDAISKGAIAIVNEKAVGREQLAINIRSELRTPNSELIFFVRVKDSREALACISNNFYRRPSEDIPVIGVTGTNGKTTTTYLIKSILEAWDKAVGLIGTIGYIIKDREYPALHTTPESLEFQGLLSEMVSAGCNYVVTEVSSHALSKKRVDYTIFNIAIFTNLTRDHLDFHHSMENYYDAKRRLFTELLSDRGTAVINVDDEWGKRLLVDIGVKNKKGGFNNSLITYGIDKKADVMAVDIENSISGVSFTLKYGDESYRIDSPLLGVTNVYNILASVSAAIVLDVPNNLIAEGIRNIKSIKGRLENIDHGQDFLCIIDYAHTPDALERLICTAREIIDTAVSSKELAVSKELTTNSYSLTANSSPRIITVFGCGGNRDRGKRPIMGEIATRLSDYVIITSDNPRKEDPLEIIKDIESGISSKNYLSICDRREAINVAIEKAGTGDIVIVAGKGHEDYQEIGDVRYNFSDAEVVRDAIRNKLKRNR